MPEQVTGCLVALFIIAAGLLPRYLLSKYTPLKDDLLNVVSVLCTLACFAVYFAFFGKIFGGGNVDEKPEDKTKRVFVEGEVAQGFYIDTSKKE